MPLYEYAPLSGHCKKCRGRFEIVQRITEAKLERCPACGQACGRLISPPMIGGKVSMSDSRVKELGMTKYVRSDDGTYERAAGTRGPSKIKYG